jgi:hypothetical protein
VKPSWRRVMRAVEAAALLVLVSGVAAEATANERCNVQLTVELTPDVPDVSEDGFLSSLLGNHPAYRLELLREDDDTVIELGLSGPGPEYRCQSVVEAMRRDARVVSMHVDYTSALATAVATKFPTEGESSGAHSSEFGLGALYWAVHHPKRAWRILLPLQSKRSARDWSSLGAAETYPSGFEKSSTMPPELGSGAVMTW